MTKLHNDYYTYAYLREDRTPYYIGKGRGKRIYCTQRAIKSPKDKSRIIFLKKNLTEAEAFKHEVYMIFVLGRKDLGTGILRNRTNGGEGVSGLIQSEETKKKIGEKNAGKTCTKEQKEKLSVAMSGEKNPWYCKTGALNPSSKAIIAIKLDGTELHFGSGREAARDLEFNQRNLSRYLKTGRSPVSGKFKGWQFLYENR